MQQQRHHASGIGMHIWQTTRAHGCYTDKAEGKNKKENAPTTILRAVTQPKYAQKIFTDIWINIFR